MVGDKISNQTTLNSQITDPGCLFFRWLKYMPKTIIPKESLLYEMRFDVQRVPVVFLLDPWNAVPDYLEPFG